MVLQDPDPVTRYHSRAEMLRSCAAKLRNQKLREEMENWAKEYDQMAELAEVMKRSW